MTDRAAIADRLHSLAIHLLRRVARSDQASGVTRLVQAMEAEGLVTRTPAPEDARIVRIRATKAGERVLQEARTRRLAALRTLLAGLSATDLSTVRRAVAILEPVVNRKP
jgi:DNA-binding MarR family transcriptional regulator